MKKLKLVLAELDAAAKEAGLEVTYLNGPGKSFTIHAEPLNQGRIVFREREIITKRHGPRYF